MTQGYIVIREMLCGLGMQISNRQPMTSRDRSIIEKWFVDKIESNAAYGAKKMWLEEARKVTPNISKRQFDMLWSKLATERMKHPGRKS